MSAPIAAKGLTEPIETVENGSAPQLALVTNSRPISRYPRLIGVDLARGIAVVMMIAFHLCYDLKTFSWASLDLPAWFWSLVPHVIGSLFLSVVGISSWLCFMDRGADSLMTLMKRGLRLVLIGIGITASTALVMPRYIVYFGVIHCIGVSILLTYPFLRNRRHNFLMGISIIAAGAILSQFHFSISWLLWLGLCPESGTGGDWYPLLPWFGFVLLGIWLGEKLYPPFRESRLPSSQKWAETKIVRGLCFLGRHSLAIYLVHQPLLVGFVKLLDR